MPPPARGNGGEHVQPGQSRGIGEGRSSPCSQGGGHLRVAIGIGFYGLGAGAMRPAAKLGFKPDHLQFHRHRPDVVSMSRTYETGGDWAPLDPPDAYRARIWTLNAHSRQAIPAFYQVPGELATHECWWVNDQMTFLGGFHHEGDREEGTVKVLDFKTGEIRIIGPGAWVAGVPGIQLSQSNCSPAIACMAAKGCIPTPAGISEGNAWSSPRTGAAIRMSAWWSSRETGRTNPIWRAEISCRDEDTVFRAVTKPRRDKGK